MSATIEEWDLDARIVRLRRFGDRLTCYQIAMELDIPVARVHRALRRAGLQGQCRGMDRRRRAKLASWR